MSKKIGVMTGMLGFLLCAGCQGTSPFTGAKPLAMNKNQKNQGWSQTPRSSQPRSTATAPATFPGQTSPTTGTGANSQGANSPSLAIGNNTRLTTSQIQPGAPIDPNFPSVAPSAAVPLQSGSDVIVPPPAPPRTTTTSTSNRSPSFGTTPGSPVNPRLPTSPYGDDSNFYAPTPTSVPTPQVPTTTQSIPGMPPSSSNFASPPAYSN